MDDSKHEDGDYIKWRHRQNVWPCIFGESMFQNRYTSMGGPGMIAFASCFPGCIGPFQIAPGQEIIAQKSAFLASTSGVELSVFFQKE